MFAATGRIAFGAPVYLWLLIAPAALALLLLWRLVQRTRDLTRLRRSRVSPVRQRWSRVGDLPLWLFVIAACAALIVALARPRGVAPGLARAGVDIVVLQDGSASMWVRDVPGGSRWSRSMRFLRRFGDALRWEDDRLALTVFARLASPQIRLTRDPNTVFFFLDHLGERSPLGLDDEAAWDTNTEQGIEWGLRLLRKDREVLGPSPNAPAFVLISDGETWSGEVARAIAQLHDARVPLFVVGVGTLAGGRMPPLPFPDDGEPPPEVSHLDRQGLQRLASEGGGRYFELDRDADRDIANAIINASRRPAPLALNSAQLTDLYWPLLAAACASIAIGALFVRRRTALWVQLAGALAALFVAMRMLAP